jgi:hypothetical protein
MLAQLAGAEINLVGVKAKPTLRGKLFAHRGSWDMNVLRARLELKIARFCRTGCKSVPKTNNSKPSRILF